MKKTLKTLISSLLTVAICLTSVTYSQAEVINYQESREIKLYGASYCSEEVLNAVGDQEYLSPTASELKKFKNKAKGYTVKKVKNKTMYVQWACFLKKGPSATYDNNGIVKRNQKVTVIGKITFKDNKVWYKVKTSKGKIGYVASVFLDTKKTKRTYEQDIEENYSLIDYETSDTSIPHAGGNGYSDVPTDTIDDPKDMEGGILNAE